MGKGFDCCNITVDWSQYFGGNICHRLLDTDGQAGEYLLLQLLTNIIIWLLAWEEVASVILFFTSSSSNLFFMASQHVFRIVTMLLVAEQLYTQPFCLFVSLSVCSKFFWRRCTRSYDVAGPVLLLPLYFWRNSTPFTRAWPSNATLTFFSLVEQCHTH